MSRRARPDFSYEELQCRKTMEQIAAALGGVVIPAYAAILTSFTRLELTYSGLAGVALSSAAAKIYHYYRDEPLICPQLKDNEQAAAIVETLPLPNAPEDDIIDSVTRSA